MGFRGMSPRQLARAMKKLGIEQKEVEGVSEVIIRFDDKEWILSNPQVMLVKQAGTESFQVSGVKSERMLGVGVETPTPASEKIEIPMEDAALVASQAGVDIETAKEALLETKGDLAAAILNLRHR